MESIDNNIIFNTIDNGIIILDEELNIRAWNKWLEIKTDIKSDDICNKNICEKFPYIDEKKLKRKIKSVLITKNSAFFSVEPHKYLIKIKSNIIIGKIFEFMRQAVTIVPYDIEKKMVCLYIYDHTKLYESSEKLKKLNIDLKELSTRDPLTHLHNRRYFSDFSQRMQNLSNRYNHDISIIILDIDNFKYINDNFGHSIGDKVIISLGNVLTENIRKSDVAARYGGEEFIILLYNASLDFASKIAENIRKDISSLKINVKNENIKYTASFGVAQFNSEMDSDLESTIHRADKALYLSKINGKNRVQIDL